MEVIAGGGDLLGHMMGVIFYEHGLYGPPEVGYAAFPSFHFLMIPLYKITGIEFFELTKLSGPIFHLIRLGAIMFLASLLFKEKKPALFFTLLLLAFFWDDTNLDPSNQNMGLIFLFFILGTLLLAGTATGGKRLLLIILFAGMVTTHPLSALLVLVLLAFFSLATFTGRDFAFGKGIRDSAPFTLLTLFGVMMAAWILFSSDWVFPAAVESVAGLFGLGAGSAVGPPDPVAGLRTFEGDFTFSRYAIMVYSFYGVLLLWGLAIALRLDFWRRLSFKKIFPALNLFPLSITILTGIWSVTRYYLVSAPFIAWFYAEHVEMRRTLAIAVLAFLLLYSFTLRYHTEAVRHAPSVEYTYSRFIVEKIPHSATVIQGVRFGPNFLALASVVEGPERIEYIQVTQGLRIPGEDFQFVTNSAWTKKHIFFYWGEELWDNANGYILRKKSSIIYSHGNAEIRAY